MARNSSDARKEKFQKTLFEAAAFGQLSVLKKMAKRLDNGEGIKKTIEITKNAKGSGAFHMAAAHGRTDICQYLIEELGFDPNFPSDQGGTPLFYAATFGKTDTLAYLCNHGADPTATDKKGNTPLHSASEYGHGECIEFLLSKGVPVDPENYRGTPLHVAASHSQQRAVEILLEHNSDFNKVSSTELFTPLLMSILGGSLNCTKVLIKAGADLKLNCPLATAISENSAEIVKCLLEAGADPNIPSEVNSNDYGKLPVEIAAECGNRMLVEMLLPRTSQLPTVPNWTVEGIITYVSSPAFKKKHEIMNKKRFSDLKAKAEQAFKRKEYFAAMRYYSALLDIAPSDATTYASRSICWLHMEEGNEALEDALTVQVLRPNWSKAYYCIGAAFMLLKKYKEASQVLLDGLRLDPTNKDIERAFREALDCMKKTGAV